MKMTIFSISVIVLYDKDLPVLKANRLRKCMQAIEEKL